MAEPDLIRKLTGFCKLSKREHYNAEHDELAAYLSIESQLFSDDLAMSEAVGRLSHDLLQWSQAVAEVREAWLWDNGEAELPEDFIAVFGCDNELSSELCRIIAAMRRLVSHLRLKKAADSQLSISHDVPISNPALYELCVKRSNRVGRTVAGSDSTVRSWQRRPDWPKPQTWASVRKWLNEHKDYDIGEPPEEC